MQLNQSNLRQNTNASRVTEKAEAAINIQVLLAAFIQACPLLINILRGAPFNARNFNPELKTMGVPR